MTSIKKLLALIALLAAIAGTSATVAGADALCARFSTDVPIEVEARTCADLP